MSSTPLPPGLKYLLRAGPRLLIPPTLVWGVSLILRVFGVFVPAKLLFLGGFLSFPAAFTFSVQWSIYVQRRDAAALGAVLTPTVEYRWLGGIELLLLEARTFGKAYLGNVTVKWNERYGTVFNHRVLFEDKIFTTEPEHIKAILSTNFNGFEKGSGFRQQFGTLLGTGVFNSDDEMWKFHRAMTRPFFGKDRIRHFEMFDRHVEDAFRQMKARFKEGYPVDWQDLVSRFTLDSATEFLFGHDVQSLSSGLRYPPTAPTSLQAPVAHAADEFAREFLSAQIATIVRSRFGDAWPLFEFWHDEVQKHMKAIDTFIGPLVRTALDKKADKAASLDKIDAEDEETLLGHLVSLTDDPQVLRDATLNILLAGRDTTAATLTFSVYKLAQNPAILKRLREEILARVGPVRPPSYDDIREMKFLRAVINETLRMYPPVPFNQRKVSDTDQRLTLLMRSHRTATEPTLFPSPIPGAKPFYIPAGVRLQYSVFVMHRRTDLWGPDALSFDPDRFLDERLHKYLMPNPFIFLPFNAGPRICLGQQFAYNEVSFMLVRLLQQFDSIALAPDADPASRPPPTFVERTPVSDGTDEVHFSTHLTMYVKNGLWVRMGEAPPADLA